MKLSILVPVYNERLYLAEIFKRTVLCPLPQNKEITELEIIVVDDCSTDGTRDWLTSRLKAFESLRQDHVKVSIRLLLQQQNQGKGCAVRRAIAESTGDIIIVQDADLEYSPTDYPKLLQPIVDGVADAVFGSRFLGEVRRVLFFWHSVVNKIVTTFSNMATDLNLTDMETCYKAISGPVARSMRLTSKRFGIEPELTARLSQMNARVYEVPIQYHGRTYEEGKKIGVLDGVAVIWHIFKFNYIDGDPIDHTRSQGVLAVSDGSPKLHPPQLRKAMNEAGFDGRRDLKILEIGSGIGNITQYLLKYGDVTATDVSSEYVSYLGRRFGFCESFHLEKWDSSTSPTSLIAAQKYDLIVALNVLDHVKDDIETLNRWRSLLNDNGVLVVSVPWGKKLYNRLDGDRESCRRYTPSTLVTTINQGGLAPITLFRDNPLGILGWLVKGKVLRQKALSSGKVSAYSMVKPLVWPIESLLRKFVGMNLVIVARSSSSQRG